MTHEIPPPTTEQVLQKLAQKINGLKAEAAVLALEGEDLILVCEVIHRRYGIPTNSKRMVYLLHGKDAFAHLLNEPEKKREGANKEFSRNS